MRLGRLKRGFSLVELMIVVAIISLLAAIGTVNYRQARARSQYTGCTSNVKNIGTALVMYAHDHGGRFPTSISSGTFTPSYIKVIPTCPSAGFSTYSSAYSSASNPDVYTVVCGGTYHVGAGHAANYPQYTTAAGLLEQ